MPALTALARTPAKRPAAAPSAALADAIASLAHDALMRELLLTPKPGLVDRRNTGAHRDMDVALFTASAAAIRPWFALFFRLGTEGAAIPADRFLPTIRPEGLACERAMFAATGGVNTHKGSVFTFGLAAAATGRLLAQGAVNADAICMEVAAITAHLVASELEAPHEATTAGEAIFRQHGLPGARGEAASGFATVRLGSLPVLRRTLAADCDAETALHATFLHLLEHNADTNLIARGGLEGAAFARTEATRLRLLGGAHAPGFHAAMCALDDAFIARNLSPGGSADLLALTWFLHHLPTIVADVFDCCSTPIARRIP